MSTKPTTIPAKILSQSILSTGTTFVINNIKGWDGNDLTAADFGSQAFGVFLNPTRTIMEIFEFDPTTIASASITFIGRGLPFTGGQTPVTANKLDWTANETTVLLGTDTPQFMALLAKLANNETVTGLWTFAQSPVVPAGATGTEAINYDQAAAMASAGGPDAGTAVKGVARLSYSPNGTPTALTSISNASPAVFTLISHGLTVDDSIQLTTSGTLPTGLALSTTYYVISAGFGANAFRVSLSIGGAAINTSSAGSGTHSFTKTTPVAVGDKDTRVGTAAQVLAAVGNNTDIAVGSGNKYVTQTGLQHSAEQYAADAGSNDTYVITLSPVPISYTDGMPIKFKANTANTGSATININGLGAKTIVKGVNTTLADGDIAAGQLCTLLYDGTNFVLQNPTATSSVNPYLGLYTNGITTKDSGDASAVQNIAHGLGIIPKKVKITAQIQAGTTAPMLLAFTVYNGTTQSSMAVFDTPNNVTNSQTFAIGGGSAVNPDKSVGVVTFDATNIIITWTKTNNPTGTYNLLWEAEA